MQRPTIQRLQELFTCDAESGSLRWNVSLRGGRGVRRGSEAGSARNKGRYRYVKIDGAHYTVATVIWAIHHGEWPESRLASKSGDATDCRISNLAPQKSLSTSKYDFNTREGRIAYSRDHRAEYPDHYRDKELRKAFGMTLARYREMSVDQDHVCAICSKPETAMRNGKPLALHVDHDHKTGEVRGLLCRNCNVAIGYFCDDPNVMRSAIAYVNHYKPVVSPLYCDWLEAATGLRMQ